MIPGKIRYVQRVLKDGRIHLYFRKGDYREGPLASSEGSDELRAEVQAILARVDKTQKAQTPRPGTVGGMLKQYEKSADFLALARSTQGAYHGVIDELETDCGDCRLQDVSRAWMRDMRDAWALRGHRVANIRLSILANALGPAIEDERVPADPFSRLKRAKAPRGKGEAHPAWEDREVHAAIDEALRRKRPGLARAIALGRWSGYRRGTICAIPRTARIEAADETNGRHRRLYWITEKRRVLSDKREDPRLTDLIERTDNSDRAVTIAYNADGLPWKERQLNQALDRLLDALAKVGGALAGASDAEIMAQLEHATDRQARDYRRQAQRRALADSGRDKVDNVVKLKAVAARKSGLTERPEAPEIAGSYA